MLNSVLEEVHRFSPHEQHDDITLVVARCAEDETKQERLFGLAESFGN
jgi:hypothetical protein